MIDEHPYLYPLPVKANQVSQQTSALRNNIVHPAQSTPSRSDNDWDKYDFLSFGNVKTLAEDMHLIDELLLVQYPEIIDPKHRECFSRCTDSENSYVANVA